MVSTQNNTVSRSKVDITGVPETMLQTLYARAKESRKPDHAIYDGKAIEIVDAWIMTFHWRTRIWQWEAEL